MRGHAAWVTAARAAVLTLAFWGVDAIAALTTDTGVAAIWMAGGVGLAGLLLWGVRLWPALVVASLGATPLYDGFVASTAPVIAANVLAIVTATWVIRRLRTDLHLASVVDVTRFVVGSLAGAVPFGVLGFIAIFALGNPRSGPAIEVGGLWVLSTLTGFTIVGGALVILVGHARVRMPLPLVAQLAGLAVLLAFFGALAYVGDHGAALLPLVLVASVMAGRGGPRGAAVASLVILGFSAASVLASGGPFGGDTVLARSLTYQVAALAIGIGLLCIGAIGAREPGAAAVAPPPRLAVTLLVAGALTLGVSESVVAPELIAIALKPQVTLITMIFGLIIVLGVWASNGLRGRVAEMRAWRPGTWLLLALAGVALFGTEELFLIALTKVPVISAVVLGSLAPFVLLAVAIARGNARMTPVVVLAAVAVLVGFYCLTPGDTWTDGIWALGVWLALGSSACAAVLLASLSQARERASATTGLSVVFAVAVAAALLLCLATGALPGADVFSDPRVMGGALYAAVAGAVIPVVVATWAVVLMGADRVALFEVVAPPMALVAVLAWGEVVPTAWQVVGVALVLLGLVSEWRAHSAKQL